jgi:uncharacterized protein (TIGR03086 family)
MSPDPLDNYRRASDWAVSLVRGATDQLDAATPCDDWDVRTVMNHMLQTQQTFVRRARGEELSFTREPQELVGDDPVAAFERARDETLQTFGQEGVIEQTGPAIEIAFADTLVHGWDLARATGQDDTMPDGLAQAAYDTIYGRFTDAQRPGVFDPEVAVGTGASVQERLLAYTGRDPAA